MDTDNFTVPPDMVGWTDETFDQASRYIMKRATLVDVLDMNNLARLRIQPGPNWFSQRRAFVQNGMLPFYKKVQLANFRTFYPSMLYEVYVDVMAHPRPHHAFWNWFYIVINIIITGCFVLGALGMIFYLL